MKIRADQLLVKKGLAVSGNQAKALILAGQVLIPSGLVEKAGQLLDEKEAIRIKEGMPFVGRGGLKLDHALKEFKISPEGRICLDIGASTGGFTDCLLKRGAQKVYAVDVGYGQLDWKLRQDPRIVIMERTNFRYIASDKIPESVSLTVIDVSFISLTKILPKVTDFSEEGGEIVALVKPQFELSPAEVKKGIVRSEESRKKAVKKVIEEAKEIGFKIKGTETSPILGRKGNQEFFLYLQK